MIEFVDAPAKHVIYIRVAAKATAKDFDRTVERIEKALADYERIALVSQVDEMTGVEPLAVLKDFWYGIQQIGHLDRFYRAAVVTDKKWIASVASWEDKLFRSIELKVFSTAELDEAIAWASEPPPTKEESEPGIVRLDTGRPDLLAYSVRGRMTGQDVKRIVPEMEAAFEKHGRIRLLLDIKTDAYPRFNLDVLRGDLFRLKRDALQHVERYVIVGGPAWIGSAVAMFDPLFRMEVRHFDQDEEDEAWTWLREPIETNATVKEIPT